MQDKEQQQNKRLHKNGGPHLNGEPHQNGELHENMVKCRQIHALQRRAAQNAQTQHDENQKAITRNLVIYGGGALLLLGVGILLFRLSFLHPPPAKDPCKEDKELKECNVKVRKYQNEVLADITDLYPSWFPETPSPTSTYPPVPLGMPPTATARVDITCRSGPTIEYPILDYLKPGMVLNIVGRNRAGDSWVVDDPHIGRTCWVYGERVEVAGDTGNVPIVQVAPPPVPVPSDTPLSCRDYTDASSCNQHGCTWDPYYQPHGRCR